MAVRAKTVKLRNLEDFYNRLKKVKNSSIKSFLYRCRKYFGFPPQGAKPNNFLSGLKLELTAFATSRDMCELFSYQYTRVILLFTQYETLKKHPFMLDEAAKALAMYFDGNEDWETAKIWRKAIEMVLRESTYDEINPNVLIEFKLCYYRMYGARLYQTPLAPHRLAGLAKLGFNLPFAYFSWFYLDVYLPIAYHHCNKEHNLAEKYASLDDIRGLYRRLFEKTEEILKERVGGKR